MGKRERIYEKKAGLSKKLKLDHDSINEIPRISSVEDLQLLLAFQDCSELELCKSMVLLF